METRVGNLERTCLKWSDVRRNDVEHTDNPGRKDHQELDLRIQFIITKASDKAKARRGGGNVLVLLLILGKSSVVYFQQNKKRRRSRKGKVSR